MEHINETAQAIRERLLDRLQRDEPAAAIPSISRDNECAVCHDTRLMRVEGGVAPCRCRKERVRQEKLLAIPERFRDCTFANFRPQNSIMTKIRDQLEQDPSRSLFLFGDYRGGKTHLAAAQYRAQIEAQLPALFRSMAGLLRELRQAELDPDYLCDVQQQARSASPFHLFIDDIDKFKVTDFKRESLFELIDTVYGRKLGLTITSNYSLGDLVKYEKLDPGIVSRIDTMCEACNLRSAALQIV